MPPRPSSPAADLQLFELRSYRTRPGRRDELIAMFEAHFLDAYERAGATIVATFTRHGEPDRWVWVRAFRSAAQREEALAGFYGSPTWKRLAAACNATIADVSDAWLLAPVPGGGTLAGWPVATAASLIELSLFRLSAAAAPGFPALYAGRVLPALDKAGAGPAALLATPAEPPVDSRRPLRAGHWFASFSRVASAAVHDAHRRESAAAMPTPKAEHWLLEPTARSALR